MPVHFPQEAVLRDERHVTIRPFREGDAGALHDFFKSLPQQIQRNAWDRIDRREVVEGWARSLDHDKVVALMALDGSRVVASASLHYRADGPLRLCGQMRWLLDPEYSRVGLGRIFVGMFIQMARENGLRHVTGMLVDGLEDDAIHALETLGFDKYVVPGYGTDAEGNVHDMVKMVLPL